ncbi:MAG TPA: T6SS immunity protein Tdi1 domain-containing protein [Flavisolibacter sp.]|jgi:hypothetical protein|nr:T6SS immunity protein Tdi1 domain-containing protein [Flavisolibacter sp.]
MVTQEFINEMGEGEKYSGISDTTIKKYRETFLIKGDTEDTIVTVWQKYGLRSYKNGLFWLINPDEYNEIAKKFPDVTNDALVFARTGIGNLFLFEQGISGKNINYLNTHTGIKSLAARGFDDFFQWLIGTETFWMSKCYGKIELKINKKYGQMKADECYTFVPALALGGKESIENMEKVKIKENLSILAQLHNGS